MAVSVFELLSVLLYNCEHEEVLRVLPLLYNVQLFYASMDTSKNSTSSILVGQDGVHVSIDTLILALLLCISSVAESAALEQYVYSVIYKRREQNIASRDLKIVKHDNGTFGLLR